jgi:[ribosomal protein S18]-alanine N-acetyltransferase
MISISIRPATLDDIPSLLALEQTAPSASHWSPDQYKSRILPGPRDVCFLVAESEPGVRGFLCARIVAGEWDIENVVVDQQHRRQGIADELMRSLLAQWNDLGGTALLLEVRESNAAARALYVKYGLREVGLRRAYYHEPNEDAILYARRRSNQ